MIQNVIPVLLALALPASAVQLRDSIPPVEDFQALGADAQSIQLGWTAPGTPPNPQVAVMYELFVSSAPFPEGGDPDLIVDWMIGATFVDGLPLPAGPGLPQEMTVGGLEAGLAYTFALRYYTLVGSSGFAITEGTTAEPEPLPPPASPSPVPLPSASGTGGDEEGCAGSAGAAATLLAAMAVLVAASGRGGF